MIFCIGNGESRKDFDLETLRPHGKIYGCNGLYKDFIPDVLIAMDYNICHEIYRSGYAFDNPVYLKQWEKNPHTMYEKLFYPETITKFLGDIDDVNNYTDEWVWKGEKKRFFVCWANNKDLMVKFKEEKLKEDSTLTDDDFKLHCDLDTAGYIITWLKKKDKVQSLKGYDTRTNAGALSLLIATQQPDSDKGIYLFGHDIYSKTKTVNNLYKNTNGYVGKKAKAIDPKNWIKHYKAIFDRFDKIQFKVVNTNKIKEWDCKNVSYISLEQFNDDLKHIEG